MRERLNDERKRIEADIDLLRHTVIQAASNYDTQKVIAEAIKMGKLQAKVLLIQEIMLEL